MELRYVLITLLKIVISTPNVLLLYNINEVYSAALMGGHLDNMQTDSLRNITDTFYEYEFDDSQEMQERDEEENDRTKTNSEEIPDPSALVLPGYNLPENIFNRGKPFYVDKDPLTGIIDFSHKSPTLKLESDLYESVKEPSDDIYDKSNIDRKDGSVNSHKASDVNQLTPNFHDFLNLPVKYNPDKYVYPLISNSYASTKVQGSVSKFHNHKDYNIKTTTIEPTENPTYYSTNKYFNPTKMLSTPAVTTTMSTTLGVTKKYSSDYVTPKPINLMNSEMAHPSFNEEFDYYDVPSSTTKKTEPNSIYITTEGTNNMYVSSKPQISLTTTKRTLSLFEQLFGDYDEPVVTTPKTVTPKIDNNLTINNNIIKNETITEPNTTSSQNVNQYQNAHAGPNILSGSNMGLNSNYEYEDYEMGNYEDNIAVENKPLKNIDDDLTIEPLNVENETKELNKTLNSHQFKESTSTAKNIMVDYDEYDYQEKEESTTVTATTTVASSNINPMTTITKTTSMPTFKVTSLPLGENHVTNSKHDAISHRDPIIVATQNLREKLNSEKVLPKPFEAPGMSVTQHTQPPSTSNIHIAPDQDTVSFVVGNHQNVGEQYIGTTMKESPYDSNPFRPLYGLQATYSNEGFSSHGSEIKQQIVQTSLPTQSHPEIIGSAITIQPMKNSEASLAIGVPINIVKQIPGQVVDEKLELNDDSIDFSKGTNSKIVFPNEKQPEFPDLLPPPAQSQYVPAPLPNRNILPLNSKPVYHQLPSNLTPPREKEVPPIRRPIRPPWDPRPGHFHIGKPEYNHPPRPPPEMSYKRIDNLPNILPQFRPNMNKYVPPGHYMSNKLVRQPLLERPSNRPIGFFEKLLPPPPPPQFSLHKNIQNLRNGLLSNNPPKQALDETKIAQDRIINEGPKKTLLQTDPFGFYQTPPQIKIANRRNSDDSAEIETLQMIQAKYSDKSEKQEAEPSAGIESQVVHIPAENTSNNNTEKTIYKVYPVNTPPIKLELIDDSKKESVVIGTRAELPLPPSKINQEDFMYEQNPLFELKERNDDPILKPHPRPPVFPVKSDFPYPLERPDPAVINPAVPETPSNTGNGLDDINSKLAGEPTYLTNNQWNTIGEDVESRIVNTQKFNSPNLNQISVTLKTFTEKPIAIAYTPTEPNLNADKYSMPNYGSPVIPEIRPGTVENADTGHSNNEFTVSAIMHTHHQSNLVKADNIQSSNKRIDNFNENSNHKNMDAPVYPKLDFEAPFQASINLDHTINQGWSVVRKNRTTTAPPEFTTVSYATTSEFNIENFKPQLEGGFKPIYNLPSEEKKIETLPSEREE